MSALAASSIVAALLFTSGQQAASGQDRFRMESLTVPARLLPAGCRLAADAAHGDPSFMMYPSLTQNPWIGTGATAAVVRRVVDGPGTVDSSIGPQRLTELEVGLVQAYRASYRTADRSKVDVFAVEFDAPDLTTAAPLNRLRGRPGRTIVLANTAVWVSPGNSGECFRAVVNHIASLEKK